MPVFEFPWWLILLVYLYIFMTYFGIGAVLTCAMLANSERRDVRRSRLRKVGIPLLGALAGGAVNTLIVLLPAVLGRSF